MADTNNPHVGVIAKMTKWFSGGICSFNLSELDRLDFLRVIIVFMILFTFFFFVGGGGYWCLSDVVFFLKFSFVTIDLNFLS